MRQLYLFNPISREILEYINYLYQKREREEQERKKREKYTALGYKLEQKEWQDVFYGGDAVYERPDNLVSSVDRMRGVKGVLPLLGYAVEYTGTDTETVWIKK